jgi:protein-L-isoaspartate(D-aspartate) O-methyltransferase
MSFDFAAARLNMIDSQVRTNDVPDLIIQTAMANAPRERFCPAGKDYLAYAESEVEYAPGACMTTPRDIAKLLGAAVPRSGETALTINSPYGAMVLARIGLKVTAQVTELASTVARAGLQGEAVTVIAGDLTAVSGRYDLVLVEGAVTEVPASWFSALVPGGRLVVVERKGPIAKARLYRLSEDGALGGRDMFDASSSLIPGFEPTPAFSF